MSSPSSTIDTEIDASVTFSEALMEQINREDVKNMVTAQRDMLCRFEKTNEMLINFNILSANRFAVANNELKAHTKLMYEMKKDLDSIFSRIRVIKNRLNKSYPDAFKACNVAPLLEDEEEEEEELRVSTTTPVLEAPSSNFPGLKAASSNISGLEEASSSIPGPSATMPEFTTQSTNIPTANAQSTTTAETKTQSEEQDVNQSQQTGNHSETLIQLESDGVNPSEVINHQTS